MKKIHVLILFALLGIPCVFPASSVFDQGEVCYQQCAGYTLVWQDDYCWGLFEYMCTMDEKGLAVQMVGAWASYVTKGSDFNFLINPIMCVGIVDECIRPMLGSCRNYCGYNDIGYAPDLYVYSSWYDPANGYVHFKIRNGGLAYMPGSSASFYSAHSDDRMLDDSDFTFIQNASIPALRPFDVRKTFGYESDSELVFEWVPEEGEYNVARLVISADPGFKERSNYNNVHDYVRDYLPAPADIRLEFPTYERKAPDTEKFIIRAESYNIGEVSSDVKAEFYYGRPEDGRLFQTDEFTLAGGARHESAVLAEFTDPSVNYVTIRLIADGAVIAEPWVFPYPQSYLIKGKVVDEEGYPVPGAIIRDYRPTDFPIMPSNAKSATADDRGAYEMPLYSEEKVVTLYGSHMGYFGNQASVRLSYGDPDNYTFDNLEIIYADIVLTQHPVEMSVGYPEHGWYIIETEKGRFTGRFAPNTGIPVRGNNGTLAIYSARCSPFITDFSVGDAMEQLPAPDVVCLDADSDDDYQPLASQQLLFEKDYPDEVPERIYFDRRGDHAYVVTADKGTPLCNIYSYSLPSGAQLYRKALGSYCGQTSAFIPSYEGSMLYIGLGVPNKASAGINHSTGMILDESGNVIESWDYPEKTYNLGSASATDFLDMRKDNLLSFKGGKLETCMAVEADSCKEGHWTYGIDMLGISKNRVLGNCEDESCIFTLGGTDYVTIPKQPSAAMVSGNYLNDDVFAGSYKGGSYLRNGTEVWSVDDEIEHLSMSPGGSYVLLALDPYGIALYDAAGNELTPDDAKKGSARGLSASERGLFYGTTKGGGIKVYALSSLTEPSSGTSTEGSDSFFNRVGMFFQYLVDSFNAVVDYFFSLFGW